VVYYLVRGSQAPRKDASLAAKIAKADAVVDELKKAVAHEFSVSREDLVVFGSLESLEKYRQAQASGDPESAPQVGIV